MRRGAAILGVVVSLATVIVGPAASAAAAECRSPNGSPDEVHSPFEGSDPTRVRLPYSPWRVANAPCPFPTEFRAVVIEGTTVTAIEGGQVVWEAPLPPGDSVRFEDVVAAVNDAAWLAEVEPGVFVVDTAVVQRGMTMTVAAPAVRELRLTTRPHVFLGGIGATARFDGVTVTSWDPATGGPDQEVEDGRPFVVYRDGSRLDSFRSRFMFLGSDRVEAYGVAWRNRAVGTVEDSEFAHNFFGTYLHEANFVEFRRNVFHDNIRYGLDPHDHSHHLVIEDNESYANGTHGIVFSNGVRDSVVRNNRVHDNAINGIVLHGASGNNVVEGNKVENNRHDGIVIIDSGDNRITGNLVRGHDVGIRMNGAGTQRATVQSNVIEDSRIGLEVFAGADGLVAQDNVYRRSRHVAVSLDAPRSELRNEQIEAGHIGIDLVSGESLIRSLRVADVDDGLVVRAGARTDLADVEVRARQAAIRTFPGSTVRRGGNVDAPDPFPAASGSGSGAIFGYIGLAAIAVAVILHGLSVARNPRRRGGRPPGHVRNTA